MAEALSCVTPIIGFKRGSVPEVITHGKNGFIVKDVQEMANSIDKLNTLDEDWILNDSNKRFSLESITSNYLKLFDSIIVA